MCDVFCLGNEEVVALDAMFSPAGGKYRVFNVIIHIRGTIVRFMLALLKLCVSN